MNLTIIIPYFNGEEFIRPLVDSLPQDLPIIIVDDKSDVPLEPILGRYLQIVRSDKKLYFSGAVNLGASLCNTDILILNQDTEFSGTAWLDLILKNRIEYGLIGERIHGTSDVWPDGYMQGTFMFVRRDVWIEAGPFDAEFFPMWGSTGAFQCVAARRGFMPLLIDDIPGFMHKRSADQRFGNSITQLLERDPQHSPLFIRTPPLVSVVIAAYNVGRYLKDTVYSLIGGDTCLGRTRGQSFQHFEVIIADDCSTDNTEEVCQELSGRYNGVRYLRLPYNQGASAALNMAIEESSRSVSAITRIDGDDMRSPNSLDMLFRVFLANPHRMIYDDMVIMHNGVLNSDKPWVMEEYDFDELIYKNQVHAGIMFPKQAYTKDGVRYPENMRSGREDWAINVALGIKGYCGVHVRNPGYYYRREGQNRTLRNTTREWHETFMKQMEDTYPDVYSGRLIMGCCGGRSTSRSRMRGQNPTGGTPVTRAEDLVGSAGMSLLQYVGGNYGSQTYYGSYTGAAYSFSAVVEKQVKNVDNRDVQAFLDMVENTHALFKRYVAPPVIAPVVEETVEPEVPMATEAAVSEPYSEPKPVLSDLSSLSYLDEASISLLESAGIHTLEQFVSGDSKSVSSILGWTLKRTKLIQEEAAKL